MVSKATSGCTCLDASCLFILSLCDFAALFAGGRYFKRRYTVTGKQKQISKLEGQFMIVVGT